MLWVAEAHGRWATTLHYFQRGLTGLGELAGLTLIHPPCVALPSPTMWSFIYSRSHLKEIDSLWAAYFNTQLVCFKEKIMVSNLNFFFLCLRLLLLVLPSCNNVKNSLTSLNALLHNGNVPSEWSLYKFSSSDIFPYVLYSDLCITLVVNLCMFSSAVSTC